MRSPKPREVSRQLLTHRCPRSLRINLGTLHPEAGSECLTKVNLSPPCQTSKCFPPSQMHHKSENESLYLLNQEKWCRLISGGSEGSSRGRNMAQVSGAGTLSALRSGKEMTLLTWKQPSFAVKVSCFQTLQGQRGSEAGALVGRQRGACRERECRLCLGSP